MNFRIILIIIIITFFEGCFIFSEKKYFLEKNDKKTEKSLFESGKRYYLSSLNFDLDQNNTTIAVNKLNQFIKDYPNSLMTKEAYKYLNNLLMKIEIKNYYIAESYFLMQRYKVSLIYFQDFLNTFPKSFFKEKVLYKICYANYKLFRKYDFFKSYEKYIKNFSNLSYNAKKLKVLYKKLLINNKKLLINNKKLLINNKKLLINNKKLLINNKKL
ncbi:tetratricopeptide repeat protein [Blattabacterium cuenoti]|uniref:tetratricopeptide repeat protein n=1 Tax=Blattabacterium cuenoti TaxID=1653831 RepID=UPI00163CEBD5|nr:tetratricopeptide repeat protein [Blattabacterium cuenoti]